MKVDFTFYQFVSLSVFLFDIDIAESHLNSLTPSISLGIKNSTEALSLNNVIDTVE